MINKVIDIFDAHKVLGLRLNKFDPALVLFLRKVTDNAFSHLVETLKSPIDHDIVDEFILANPNIDITSINTMVSGIRSAVVDIYNLKKGIVSEYFEVRCIEGKVIIDLTQPTPPIEVPPLNYDVPWGCPNGTVKASHMDRLPIGVVQYIWCEIDEFEVPEIDIVLGEVMHVITPGLWKAVDSETLEPYDLADHKALYTRDSGIMVASPHKRVSIIPELLEPKRRVSFSKVNGVKRALIFESGDYSDSYIKDFTVVFSDHPDAPKEHSVVINGISFLLTTPGDYLFNDMSITLVTK